LALVGAANPKAMPELTADGQLIAITPTGADTRWNGCQRKPAVVDAMMPSAPAS
jgi:hypothetical protein